MEFYVQIAVGRNSITSPETKQKAKVVDFKHIREFVTVILRQEAFEIVEELVSKQGVPIEFLL
jgi:hypothetical protein